MELDLAIWPARVSKSAEIPTSAGTLVRLEQSWSKWHKVACRGGASSTNSKRTSAAASDPRDLIRSLSRVCVFSLFLLAFVLFQSPASSSANRQIAKETSLMTKTLPDVPGKEGLIETVLLSPGEVVPAHQHNADVFAYVLDGSIITQLKGGKPQTVHTGEVFYESPTDIHVDSRNASKTQPAKLLVFFVKKIGAPPTVAVAKAAH